MKNIFGQEVQEAKETEAKADQPCGLKEVKARFGISESACKTGERPLFESPFQD